MSALDVQAAGAAVKLRRPWVVGALSLIPFYWQCWYYLVNREMRDFGAARGEKRLGASRPVRSVLAVTLGYLVIVPPLVSTWRSVRRLETCERTAGWAPAAVVPLLWALSISFALGWTGVFVTSIALAVTLCVAAEVALIGITVAIQRRLTSLWETVGQPVTQAPDPG